MAIKSFLDLDVYKRSYSAAIRVKKEILDSLPSNEKYDLKDQSGRASKTIPAIIAEGYARKHHAKDWQKYIDQAIGEANEMIVHISLAKDMYPKFVEPKICTELIEEYNIIGKQLFRLGQSWNKKSPPLSPSPDSPPTSRFSSLALLSAPLALTIPGGDGPVEVVAPENIPSGVGSAENVIQASLNLLVLVGIIAALIFLIYGGVLWVTSSGDKAKLDRARHAITYSIIGLIVIILAWTIVGAIGILLGSPGGFQTFNPLSQPAPINAPPDIPPDIP